MPRPKLEIERVAPTTCTESCVVFGGAGVGGSVDRSSLAGTDGFVIEGITDYDYAGRSVSTAGDVNNDGLDDLIVGANRAGDAGESYVTFGTGVPVAGGELELSALSGTNGFVLNGVDAYDEAGYAVGGAGDWNGDGIDDLIIGAHFANPGQAGGRPPRIHHHRRRCFWRAAGSS